jgi:DNA-binding transcriptional MerR regulator
MFLIGDFARLGLVSVRMLRHYDAIGLLRPARTDPASGYRYYAADQLPRLNRIAALKDLGFTLDQVRDILDARVGAAELHGMLLLRRAELAERIAADHARLARVDARLRTIDTEGRMPGHHDVRVKRLPALRVAERTGTAPGFDPGQIGPVVGPLFDGLCGALDAAGLTATGPGIASYAPDPAAGGDAVRVHAAFPVAARPGRADGFTVVDLPEVAAAATLVHEGAMSGVVATAQALARWIGENGHRGTGYARELYLVAEPHPEHAWVTELQEPLSTA